MPGLPRLKPVSMTASVRDAIRQALYDGRFGPGQSLSEAALANEMGVSRGPVRESLLLLSQEGLVVHSPNRGFAIVQFSDQDLKEVDQVRTPLETMALELARTRVEPSNLERLRSLKKKLAATQTWSFTARSGRPAAINA